MADYLDDKGILDKRHKYYAQVQGQLLVTELKECIFAVYTRVGLHVTIVKRDAAYAEHMAKVLRRFYIKKVMPTLLQK